MFPFVTTETSQPSGDAHLLSDACLHAEVTAIALRGRGNISCGCTCNSHHTTDVLAAKADVFIPTALSEQEPLTLAASLLVIHAHVVLATTADVFTATAPSNQEPLALAATSVVIHAHGVSAATADCFTASALKGSESSRGSCRHIICQNDIGICLTMHALFQYLGTKVDWKPISASADIFTHSQCSGCGLVS